MNYLTDSRRHALAAEYVLGTLQGAARVRFQRLIMEHPSMRKTLWGWERHLNELGSALPPQPLPPYVWEKIQARLGFETAAIKPVATITALPVKNTTRGWQWFSGLSAVAAVILAALLLVPLRYQEEPAAQVAIIQNEKAEALWSIQLTPQSIDVQATPAFHASSNNDYELWLVATDGRPPVSLGLLPKQGKLLLPRAGIIDQIEIAALAVSLEPLGGSPNGQPTTVLFTAQLITL